MSAQHCKPAAGKTFVYRFLTFLLFLNTSAAFAYPPSAHKATSFTARFLNLEATSKETFRFSAVLYNGLAHTATYNLEATLPDGWSVSFKVQGMQLTSFQLDSNKSQEIAIEIVPSPGSKPGKYNIPVTAISDQNDKYQLNLEAVVKGSYALALTTPNGLLSGEATEGHSKSITLSLKNDGTLPLDNVNLTAQAPPNWTMTFEPSKVERIDPGSTVNVTAQLTVPDKTIAGDYQATVTANNPNANSNFTYRLTVTTSWLTGWIGILVILAAIGMIYYLVKKYGRR